MSNLAGVSGLAPGISFMPIKIVHDKSCLWAQQIGQFHRVASAIDWARTHGAHIISCSWHCVPNDDIADAFDEAYASGCLCIASSGNDTALVAFPANLDNIVAVGATTCDGERFLYSNIGWELDIVAPSGELRGMPCTPEGIYTLDGVGSSGAHSQGPESLDCPENVSYDYHCCFGGTSAACPQVAGVAALVLSRLSRPFSQYNNLPHLLDSILTRSAQDTIGGDDVPGWDFEYGWGQVNALKALLSVARGDANNSGYIDIDIDDIVSCPRDIFTKSFDLLQD
jgi:subtilisin family serine protease